MDGDSIFHLAIPTHNKSLAKEFYRKLGCKIGREYDDRISVKFFGDQVVCHLTDKSELDTNPDMYPRHFGQTFLNENQFEEVLSRAQSENLTFFQEPMIRFEGRPAEHRTFFLEDPSWNLLEFKWYKDPEKVY